MVFERNLIKSERAIGKMRIGGGILGQIIKELSMRVVPGVSGKQLDNWAREMIENAGATPAFLGYQGYPATLCLSINEEIVHGIPKDQIIKNGDLVKLDLGLKYQGWNLDCALTIGIGQITQEEQRLINTAKAALGAGIDKVGAGIHLGDVQAAIQQVIEAAGFGLVMNLTGHGIGKNLHEPPSIPNYGKASTGMILQTGMTICLEPMITFGTGDNYTAEDGWTVVSADHSHAAHFEHTILVTKTGAEVLTKF